MRAERLIGYEFVAPRARERRNDEATMSTQDENPHHNEFDVLLAPGRTSIASKLDQRLDAAAPGAQPPPSDPGFRGIIPMGNLVGLPALVLPCGFAENRERRESASRPPKVSQGPQ